MHNRGENSMEKAKDFKGSINKLFKYNKRFIKLIVISLILSFLSSVLSIIGPDKLKDITNTIQDGIITGIDLEHVRKIGIILIVLYSLSVIFNYVQGFIMTTVTNKFQKDLRRDIEHKKTLYIIKNNT